VLLIGAGGCRAFVRGGEGHPVKKQTRVMSVTLLEKPGSPECEAKFSTLNYHAFNGDEIAWEITNTCQLPQTAWVEVKPGTPNPFTDPKGKWEVGPINKGDTQNTDLVVGPKGTVPPGVYQFNIVVKGGKSYDPRLEIDP
jgi:hypothetical protein